MNRRIALKHLAMVTGGIALIPSCDFSSDDIIAAYEKLQIKASEKDLLGAISNTIIPAGEIKGALDIEVPDFILVMVNDCVKSEDQNRFMAGLRAFPEFVKTKAGSGFSSLSDNGREEIIKEGLAAETEESANIKYFLQMAKRFTIQGYMASEYIQTEVIPYSLIPGEYNGAVLISDINKPRING
ncbi:gluconate 2-dehydrogenase subunit 3 family protein [Algoriphagus sediminis]|uniref:Gluconate 2-dehydrogenase subunit 3 family protein n=1 Tax=Algoriphagus sediminis TaxID=3057113 RepID=A0ABT7YDH2_9BACT|nr:gluconate 2-dehydrogenase subunit 3 family protein [Algoriphagus sediminis]MDN3204254.1 gluconate 2-dehydrogenase subunit 3 family protein [Algoriphagus sediminis]